MSDEQEPIQQPKETKVSQDWSTDYFPTSAKPVFWGWGVMVGGIILLCSAVYFTSEHPEKPAKPSDSKKQEAAQHLAGIQDTEDDE